MQKREELKDDPIVKEAITDVIACNWCHSLL